GKEYTIATARGLVRVRLFASGGLIYEATVIGTKEQVQAKEADLFLDSYKLTELATGNPPADPDKLADKAATVIPGDLFAYLESAVKEKRVAEAGLKGFTLTKNLYRESPEKGGILIGFNVGLKKFFDKDVVGALQPIFLTKD